MRISGPLLVLRLQNTQGRVIYLFGDVHLHIPTHQTECPLDPLHEAPHFIDHVLHNVLRKNTDSALYVEADPNTSYPPDKLKLTPSRYLDRMRELCDSVPPSVHVLKFDIRYSPLLLPIMDALFLPTDTLRLLGHAVEQTYRTSSRARKKKAFDEFDDLTLLRQDMKNWKYKHYARLRFEDPAKIHQMYQTFHDRFTVLRDLIFGHLSLLTDFYVINHFLKRTEKVSYLYAGFAHAIHIATFLTLKLADKWKITHTTNKKATREMLKAMKPYNSTTIREKCADIATLFGSLHPIDYDFQCVDISGFPKQLR